MDAALAETALAPLGADSTPPSSRDVAPDAWDVRERDVPRRARLAVAALVPVVTLALGLTLLPSLPRAEEVVEGDEPIEALLVEAPEVPPPPEPPAPEPAAVAAAPMPGPRIQRVETPRVVPTAPPEKVASAPPGASDDASVYEGPAGGGGPPGGTGTGFAPAPPPPPKSPPPPVKPAAPAVPETIEPPKAISMKSPAYPSAAKAAGVEGTVVVSYTVGESGAVTEARVVKGPPELAQACLDAVRAWRFTPAMSGGRAVSVKRSARFPFRLKT